MAKMTKMRHIKRTLLVPRGIVILFTVGLTYLALYGAFASVYYSRGTYVESEQNSAVLSYLRGPMFTENALAFLTLDERAHMTDVKRVLDVTFLLFLLAVGVLIGVVGTLRKMKPQLEELFARGFWNAGWTLLAICVLAGGASLLSFDKFWVLFHVVFFPQGNWLFPTNSVLIQLYPPAFFQAFTTRVFSRVVLLGILAVGLGWFVSRMQAEERFFKSKLQKPRARRKPR